MATPAALARAMHAVIEPIHTIAYFSAACNAAWEGLGLEPVTQGYVAGRAAPLGAVGAGPVAAVFFNFNPAMIEMGVPAAWEIVSPAQVLAARAQAMQETLTRLEVPEDGVAEATELARRGRRRPVPRWPTAGRGQRRRAARRVGPGRPVAGADHPA